VAEGFSPKPHPAFSSSIAFRKGVGGFSQRPILCLPRR
jgi:hypothetical protein